MAGHRDISGHLAGLLLTRICLDVIVGFHAGIDTIRDRETVAFEAQRGRSTSLDRIAANRDGRTSCGDSDQCLRSAVGEGVFSRVSLSGG